MAPVPHKDVPCFFKIILCAYGPQCASKLYIATLCKFCQIICKTCKCETDKIPLDRNHYHMVAKSTRTDDCTVVLWTVKPSRCTTNTKVNSAFIPSGVSKSSNGHLAGVNVGLVYV